MEKEKKAEHSPLPWHTDRERAFIWGQDKEHGEMIAEIRNWGYLTSVMNLTEEEAVTVQYANAEFIVKACNNYYDLQKALEHRMEEVEKLKEQNKNLNKFDKENCARMEEQDRILKKLKAENTELVELIKLCDKEKDELRMQLADAYKEIKKAKGE